MPVLVTGANGFLGSHLVDRLLAGGGSEVRVLVRPSSDLRWLDGKPIEIVHGDVTQSPAELSPALDGVDRVYHLAGLTKAVRQARLFAVNELGTRNLLQACLKKDTPPERFVLVSSAGALGPAPAGERLDETRPPAPVTAYGRSKLAAERVAREYSDHLAIAIVRPGAIYGPRDYELLPAFQALRRGLLLRLGRGVHHVNMAHAADVARAVELAGTEPGAAGEDFLVGGFNTTQGEVAEAIARALGRRRLLRLSAPAPLVRLAAGLSTLVGWLSGKPRIFTWGNASRLLARNWAFNQAKAERLLGYRPEWDLERGLADTVEWYHAQGLL